MTVDWERLRGRTVFVTGADKNAGKTTLLNWLLGGLRRRGLRPAFLSAGYDGEEADHLSGRTKPRVAALPGELVATSEAAIETADAGLDLLEVFPQPSVLGRPVLCRVRRAGTVELIGPTGNRGIAAILERLQAAYRPDAVLVDGAIDRLTQVSSAQAAAAHVAAYAMVLRVEPSTLPRAASAGEGRARNCRCSRISSAARCQEMIELPGALTEKRLAELPADDRPLVLEDFTKVFVDGARLAELRRRRPVFLRRTFELLFFAANLFDVSEDDFFRALAPAGQTPADVLLNPYRAEAPCA
jgi:hypothetical protein